MAFREYKKIHRLGKDETLGILTGKCYVQEKIDGANTQIWLDPKDGQLHMGSRSQEVTSGFNGFVDYVKSNEPIKQLLADHPDWHLYGEWLVRHTLHYKETNYKKFYLFDIHTPEGAMDIEAVHKVAEEYGVPTPQLFGVFENPTQEELQKFVGVTNLGEKGEGIVIKNIEFVNQFGDKYQYAKIVAQEFLEDNGLVFGGNNKHSDTYWEMWVVNKYMTIERVQKVMNKIQPTLDKKLDYEHTSRVSNTAYHDLITEEMWEISRKVVNINFKALGNLCQRKAAQIYKDVLNQSFSVADLNK
jgi:hypothetical protein